LHVLIGTAEAVPFPLLLVRFIRAVQRVPVRFFLIS
jgi:hypothetical protein